jgi:dCMP deaminase
MTSQLEKDIYYLRIAKEVSKRSKCLSRKIGSVLVKDDSVISIGFNGPPRGVKHCNERDIEFYEALDNQLSKIRISTDDKTCPRRYMGYKSGQGLHLCQAAHSERNTIYQSAKLGISTKDTTLYAYCGRPCKDCCIAIVNAGIKTIVCLEKDTSTITLVNNSGEYDEYSKVILEEANVEIRRVKESSI